MCSEISSNGVGGPQSIGQLSETEIGQFLKGTLLGVRAGAGLSRILPEVWCAFTSCSTQRLGEGIKINQDSLYLTT